ncbi:hypothetical protein WJX81_006527 [Elliptochloris bilobata]|uniref:Peptidase S26 domain-containing protein n=1 Tax=Elliptochloris bilobata TaxID=381761 RepID=A0AAW1S9N7_9CHLO
MAPVRLLGVLPKATSLFGRELRTLVKAVGVAHLIHEFVFELSIAYGPSMMPTIDSIGDVLVVDKWSAWRRKIEVGDVVLALSARTPHDRIIKRVLGMEGDIVRVLPTSRRPEGGGKQLVPPGHVWLQGDNTLNSTDSRDFGPVPYNMVLGRVVFKIAPLGKMGFIERKIPEPWYG